MMKEARIYLDLLPDQTLRSGARFLDAGERICLAFGGYTSRFALGCWRVGDRDMEFDKSVEFSVAIHPADWPALRNLAVELAEGQKTVYVVSPFGESEILPVPPTIAMTVRDVIIVPAAPEPEIAMPMEGAQHEQATVGMFDPSC